MSPDLGKAGQPVYWVGPTPYKHALGLNTYTALTLPHGRCSSIGHHLSLYSFLKSKIGDLYHSSFRITTFFHLLWYLSLHLPTDILKSTCSWAKRHRYCTLKQLGPATSSAILNFGNRCQVVFFCRTVKFREVSGRGTTGRGFKGLWILHRFKMAEEVWNVPYVCALVQEAVTRSLKTHCILESTPSEFAALWLL